jgi:hypothetical protein
MNKIVSSFLLVTLASALIGFEIGQLSCQTIIQKQNAVLQQANNEMDLENIKLPAVLK